MLVGGDGGPSGVPRHITALTRALAPQARITVLSAPCTGGYRDIAALGGRHIALPGLHSGFDPRTWQRGRAALAACLDRSAPDLVWAHARMPVIYLRQLLASGQWRPAPHVRVALTYHGLPFGPGHRLGTGPVALRLERRLLADVPPMDLVFLTRTQHTEMTRVTGAALARHRCHVLGNCSDLGPPPAPAHRPASGRHLVMTGRAGWQKNYTAALRLMRHLPDDITLSLCGNGTDSAGFAALVQRHAGPAAPRVQALGPLADVRPLLAGADGYMLLSRYEGQPIGALEACEYGLPLILAPFTGAAELMADHPMAVTLSGPPQARARTVADMLGRFQGNRPVLEPKIKAHWATRYAPHPFETAARALVFDRFRPPDD